MFYILMRCQETRLALPHLLCVQVSSCKIETNEHQMIGRLVLAKILKYQAVACDFDFNSNIPVKYFADVLEWCTKLFITCVYLCYSKYLFLAHRSSELTSEKEVNF